MTQPIRCRVELFKSITLSCKKESASLPWGLDLSDNDTSICLPCHFLITLFPLFSTLWTLARTLHQALEVTASARPVELRGRCSPLESDWIGNISDTSSISVWYHYKIICLGMGLLAGRDKQREDIILKVCWEMRPRWVADILNFEFRLYCVYSSKQERWG